MTCNYCFNKMSSKYFGLCKYCTAPKCPAYGLIQLSVEELSGVDKCMYCREHKKFEDLFEVSSEEEFTGYLCNKCLHKQLKIITKKNGLSKSKR